MELEHFQRLRKRQGEEIRALKDATKRFMAALRKYKIPFQDYEEIQQAEHQSKGAAASEEKER